MANHCGLNSWKSNSVVAMSKSAAVEGPYTFEATLLPAFAHNPTVRRAGDGTFLIYFIGGWNTTGQHCKGDGIESIQPDSLVQPTVADTCNGMQWPKSCGPNMPGPSKDCCGPESASYKGNGGCGITIASSKSLSGPWTLAPMIITDQFTSDEVYCTHTNPR